MEHRPVLADRILELLVPPLRAGGVFVDATLGRGGHAAGILAAAPAAELIGIDRDQQAVDESLAHLSSYSQRVRVARAEFSSLPAILERFGVEKVRGVLFDLGVSSPQLDRAERGFSFRHEGPLDMRMDPSAALSADEVVNRYPEKELSRVIKLFGEERFAARVARAIVASRPIATTTELAEIVKQAIPAATRRTGGHPARRTFQAIRIEVNQELAQLQVGLEASIDALEPGGRVAVLTYHSLEDRLVKKHFASEVGGCTCPPDFPMCTCGAEARIRILTRKPLRPGPSEIEDNPRSSAAKLRAAERVPVGGVR